MRLNLRMIGILHGILLHGPDRPRAVADRQLQRRRPIASATTASMYLLLIGLAMMVLGFLGMFLGNLIKAAVSRQREYLADASAVQFTRNPEGIAGALKRIGSAVFGSKLASPRAAEASHMYFAEGVSTACSPRIRRSPERIRRLDPQWDGKYPPPLGDRGGRRSVAARRCGRLRRRRSGTVLDRTVPVEVVRNAAEQVGNPTEIHRAVRRRAGRRDAAAGRRCGPRTVRRPGGDLRLAARRRPEYPRSATRRAQASIGAGDVVRADATSCCRRSTSSTCGPTCRWWTCRCRRCGR